MGGSSATSASRPTDYESLKNITFRNAGDKAQK
jgi:hypothetical protein